MLIRRLQNSNMIPSEKNIFKDEVNDSDMMDYVTSEPHMHVNNINIIHELTSFCFFHINILSNLM